MTSRHRRHGLPSSRMRSRACTSRTPAARSEPTQQQQTRSFSVRTGITQYAVWRTAAASDWLRRGKPRWTPLTGSGRQNGQGRPHANKYTDMTRGCRSRQALSGGLGTEQLSGHCRRCINKTEGASPVVVVGGPGLRNDLLGHAVGQPPAGAGPCQDPTRHVTREEHWRRVCAPTPRQKSVTLITTHHRRPWLGWDKLLDPWGDWLSGRHGVLPGRVRGACFGVTSSHTVV